MSEIIDPRSIRLYDLANRIGYQAWLLKDVAKYRNFRLIDQVAATLERLVREVRRAKEFESKGNDDE